MDFIELGSGAQTRHAMDIRYGYGYGHTFCGLTILNGVTGGCIIPLINCKRCIKTIERINR
jgi:hypothetical protein